MARLWRKTLYGLTWFHRWAGIVLCLVFAMWFASGAVMVFVPFPALGNAERLAKSALIDMARLTVAPSRALAEVKDADDIALTGIGDRPVYLVSHGGAQIVAIAGDAGERLPMLAADEARAIAERFSGGVAREVEGPFDYDQWVVYQGFDPVRPFFRVALNDPASTELYVSAVTGQVLQRTTRSERLWNWFGSVVHWIYFTPLRKSWYAWDEVVWWLSWIGVLMTGAGIWLGIRSYLRLRRVRTNGLSPYPGWLGWHHAIGLFASLFVLTWIVSGWLSMDHGYLFSNGQPRNGEAARLQGMSIARIAEAASVDALKALPPSSEVHFGAVAGHPFVVAQSGKTPASSIVFLDVPLTVLSVLPDDLLLSGVRAGWPNDTITPRGHAAADDMYSLAEGLPENAALFVAERTDPLLIYLNPVTGKLAVAMDASRRAYAWVYYGLHTFNFPGLTARPLLRIILVLAPLTLGFVFSVTGVIVGVQRLLRDMKVRRPVLA